MSVLAPTAPDAVTLVNPLDIAEDAPQKVEAAVMAMVDSVVGTVEEELRRAARRRAVTAAIRAVRRQKYELDQLLPGLDVAGAGFVGAFLDGVRAELVDLFKVINASATDEQVAAVVDAFLQPYRDKAEPAKATERRRGKSSGG